MRYVEEGAGGEGKCRWRDRRMQEVEMEEEGKRRWRDSRMQEVEE